ncbi:MAG: tyrosine-protein phosphatase [Promicromonosporaceae bacterium]|nr:tyrosine-protein phosphatase [Promicromonosporaceae bacterium]
MSSHSTTSSVSSPSSSRVLPIQGARNFRDLGGYPTKSGREVKYGRVIRSAELSGLTESDREYLARQVHIIADLRTTHERQELVTPEIVGVANIHLPIFEQGGHDNNITRAVAAAANGEFDHDEPPMVDLNREFVTSEMATASYRALIDHVLAAPEDKAVVFHCTAGKDRTGMAAVILLIALGVDQSHIYADYLETNAHLAEHVDQIVSAIPDATEAEVIRSFWIAKESYLDAALDEMRVRFGSVENYLRDALGLDDHKLTALREALLS